MFKYFNGQKYSLHKRFGRWMLTSSLRTKLAHDIWNYYNPEDTLKQGDIIHHINGDKSDDRIENLQKMIRAEHSSLHMSGINHPFYEKHLSKEIKKKISKKLKGHETSEEARKKMSKARRGDKHPNWKGGRKQKSLALDNGTIEANCSYVIFQNVNSIGIIQISHFGLTDRRRKSQRTY